MRGHDCSIAVYLRRDTSIHSQLVHVQTAVCTVLTENPDPSSVEPLYIVSNNQGAMYSMTALVIVPVQSLLSWSP